MSSARVKVCGLVLARGGSVSVPLKNLAPLVSPGENLLSRCLNRLKQCRHLDAIYVSTDNPEVEAETERCEVNVFKRDPKLASAKSSSVEAVVEFLKAKKQVDVVVLVQCTAPFLQAAVVDECVQKLISEGLDSVFSVSRSHALRWSCSNRLKPLNFDPSHRPRRQDWEGELIENGMVYAATRETVLNGGVLQNVDNCGVVEVDKKWTLEIDDLHDLWLARVVIKELEAKDEQGH